MVLMMRLFEMSVNGFVYQTDGRVRITQRNCQTWVIEAAEQLAKEGIFEQKVVDFLRSTRP